MDREEGSLLGYHSRMNALDTRTKAGQLDSARALGRPWSDDGAVAAGAWPRGPAALRR